MKCSDVSNPTKAWSLYSEWIDRITSEFLAQGDKEKQMGLPISPFCNREASNTALSQKSFINYIVGPLYDAMHSWRPLGVAMEGLIDNRKRFCPEVSSTPDTGQSRSRRTSLATVKDSH